jgi:ketosteroid isomerase-like protein
MHKVLFSAAILCLLLAAGIPARAQEQPEAEQLRSLETQITTLYKQRKIEQIAALLDEDFVITFEDGTTHSKTGYVSYNAMPSVHVIEAETSDVKVHLHGNTAILTGVYHERGDEKGKPYDYHDRFTDVWMKKDGKWRMIASHYAVPSKE